MIPFPIEWAQRTPDAPAFISPGVTLTFGEVLRAAQAAAAWLHHCGVRPGDVAGLGFDASPVRSARQVSLFYALLYLGAPVLPIYPDVPPAVRGTLAARVNARWLIAWDPIEAPAGCTRLDLSDFDPESDRWKAAPAPYFGDPDRPCRYEFTSGSTGEPKVVAFTAAQYAGITRSNVKCFGWTAGDRLLPVSMWPGKVGVRALVQINAAGGALVNVPFPDTRRQLAEIVEEFGVTCMRSVPWRLRQLLACEPSPRRYSPPLRFLETAGASIKPQEIRAIRAALTPGLRVSYGSSESGVMAHLGADDPCDAGPMLLPGMEGQAVDDRHRPLPAGVAGRLRFRAPWLPGGYIGNERASAERFREGWYYPGDAGSVDPEGRVTVQGRTDGVINHGGSKILPRDVEQVLEQHPDVAEAVVIGVPHLLKGEVPVAFVVPRGNLRARAIADFCAGRIEEWRIPAVFLTVESLPRTPDGKVLHSQLRNLYAEWERQCLGARSR